MHPEIAAPFLITFLDTTCRMMLNSSDLLKDLIKRAYNDNVFDKVGQDSDLFWREYITLLLEKADEFKAIR